MFGYWQDLANDLRQINGILSQIDEVSQRNSVLVDRNATTVKVLERQSADMAERVAFFKLDWRTSTNTGDARVRCLRSFNGAATARGTEHASARATRAARLSANGKGNNGQGPSGRLQAMVTTAFK